MHLSIQIQFVAVVSQSSQTATAHPGSGRCQNRLAQLYIAPDDAAKIKPLLLNK